MSPRDTRLRLATLAAAAVLLAPALAAGDETPTPAPKPTSIVITNENLGEYADKGHVTTVGTSKSSAGSSSQPAPNVRWEGDTADGMVGREIAEERRDEEDRRRYWRSVYQQQLDLVEALANQIQVLDREIPSLWRDFYSRDDPMYRDGVIKPRLDEALARRASLEERLAQERAQLSAILQRARRDGAQQSWFRDMTKPDQAGQAPASSTPEDGSVSVDQLGEVDHVDGLDGVDVVDPDDV